MRLKVDNLPLGNCPFCAAEGLGVFISAAGVPAEKIPLKVCMDEKLVDLWEHVLPRFIANTEFFCTQPTSNNYRRKTRVTVLCEQHP